MVELFLAVKGPQRFNRRLIQWVVSKLLRVDLVMRNVLWRCFLDNPNLLQY